MQGDPAIVLSGAVIYKDHKKFNAIIKADTERQKNLSDSNIKISRVGFAKTIGLKSQNLSG